MGVDKEQLEESLVSIASSLKRLEQVYKKAISKLDEGEQSKYASQFAWFSKKVNKAMDDAGFKLIDLAGQFYDPGMAVTPINIDEFDTDDVLLVTQTIEPIIMRGSTIVKTGTVVLGRVGE